MSAGIVAVITWFVGMAVVLGVFILLRRERETEAYVPPAPIWFVALLFGFAALWPLWVLVLAVSVVFDRRPSR